MKKGVWIVVVVILEISACFSVPTKTTGNYSYIGKFCTPTKFAQLPCLKDFCAAIDHEMNVWAKKNGSFQSKLTDL